MKKFFLQLFFGNFASKALFLAADAVAVLALPLEQFGAFVFLQGLIISGAILGVWGRDQAVISVTGRAAGGGAQLNLFLKESRARVARWSLLAALIVLALTHFSNVQPSIGVLVLVGVLIGVQAQLIINTAALRACARAYESVLYFDGIKNMSVFGASIVVLIFGTGYEVLLYGWTAGVLISLFLSHRRLATVLTQDGRALAQDDLEHARTITIFGGIWGVTRLVTAQLVVVASAYLLTPEELGVVGFYMKLLTMFTFIQTVMVQTVAPTIGELGKSQNLGEARRIYAQTTLFLAAVTTPLIGACLLAMPWITQAFDVAHVALFAWTLPLVFFVHALNIGTGIIGQFIIHFGRSKELLYISITGAGGLFVLLIELGQTHGIDGVLIAHAVSALLLIATKHLFSARVLGIHGIAVGNILLIGFGLLAYLIAARISDIKAVWDGVAIIGVYVATCTVVSLVVIRYVMQTATSRAAHNADPKG